MVALQFSMLTDPVRKSLQPKRILLAEDDAMVAITLSRFLSALGHSVDVAEDAKQALANFERDKHALVITDFKMPQMDGLELAEAVKKRSPTTPVILITAYAETVQATGGVVSNVDIVLGKPCSVTQLSAALSKIFPAG